MDRQVPLLAKRNRCADNGHAVLRDRDNVLHMTGLGDRAASEQQCEVRSHLRVPRL